MTAAQVAEIRADVGTMWAELEMGGSLLDQHPDIREAISLLDRHIAQMQATGSRRDSSADLTPTTIRPSTTRRHQAGAAVGAVQPFSNRNP